MMLIAAGPNKTYKKSYICIFNFIFLISRTLEIIKIYFSNDEIKNIRMIGVGPEHHIQRWVKHISILMI